MLLHASAAAGLSKRRNVLPFSALCVCDLMERKLAMFTLSNRHILPSVRKQHQTYVVDYTRCVLRLLCACGHVMACAVHGECLTSVPSSVVGPHSYCRTSTRRNHADVQATLRTCATTVYRPS